jgi:2-polyprenyl-6-methoxyphenol hydroxylase-like FAD-dependent oxidoreductase
MFLFTFADADPTVPSDISNQKVVLRERFANGGWECSRILDALDATPDLYFDRVSQIEMSTSWVNGRVALVGDAAFCVSLLGGQGSALAMTAAYILAGELHRADGRYHDAFARYQQVFQPFVSKKQRAARRFAGAFAPKSKMSLLLRNRLFGLLSIGWIAKLIAGREFSDRITLPDY